MDIIPSRHHSSANTSNGLSYSILESVTAYFAMDTAKSKHIAKTGHTLQVNDNNQLSHNSLELVIGHYAIDLLEAA